MDNEEKELRVLGWREIFIGLAIITIAGFILYGIIEIATRPTEEELRNRQLAINDLVTYMNESKIISNIKYTESEDLTPLRIIVTDDWYKLNQDQKLRVAVVIEKQVNNILARNKLIETRRLVPIYDEYDQLLAESGILDSNMKLK